MKVTFPLMGNAQIFVTDLLSRLDVEYVVPPQTTTKTIELGVRYSPEMACFPFKVTLGNFIEGIEAGGEAGLMVGGVGPCRFGYYAETQRRILHQIGYKVPMFILEPPLAHPAKFYMTFKELAPKKTLRDLYHAIKISWRKAVYIERIEEMSLKIRCFEKVRGDTSKAKKKAIKILASAFLESEIERAYKEAQEILNSVKKEERDAPKIGIVGEFYILLEPFVNHDIEVMLGEMGFYVERAVYLTDWLNPGTAAPVTGHSKEEVIKAAAPYLSHFVGGDGRQTIGHTILYLKNGFEGIIHLLPFTCMPELIAKSILPRISSDYDLPVLYIVIDEQTGKAGLQTRIEAFADLIRNRHLRGIMPRGDLIGWVEESPHTEPVGVTYR
jgi:predicted nucleotide-binding protein (sugar kinase/HSP70/actin superfamily)